MRSSSRDAPFASASWIVVVTSVRNSGSAAFAAPARITMSPHPHPWYGGSSHVYWKSRSNQPGRAR